jgi:hypothetical protein
LVSSAFCSPSGKARKRSSTRCSFLQGFLPPLLEAPRAGARLEVLDVAEEHGHEHGGRSLQRGRVMSISPTPRMPYFRASLNCVSRLTPTASLGSLLRNTLIVDVPQKRHHLRIRADRVCYVHEREPHLRRDVA